jgi:hypothetical protein
MSCAREPRKLRDAPGIREIMVIEDFMGSDCDLMGFHGDNNDFNRDSMMISYISWNSMMI